MRQLPIKSPITRRRVLGTAAGAALATLGSRAGFAIAPSGAIVAVQVSGTAWQPEVLSPAQGRALGRLVEAIIPTTDTPGAFEAGVHEYIDLAVSLAGEDEREAFVEGFAWLETRSVEFHGGSLDQIEEQDLITLLDSVSDRNESLPAELQPGGEFFSNLKQRTIFGYYTSLTGRTRELGLSDIVTMETLRGCRHSGGSHA